MKFCSIVACAIVAGWLSAPGGLRADVKLAAPFSDHMVLQQGTRVPVWGTADAGEQVRVTLGGQAAAATADKDGNWRADLSNLSAGGPLDLAAAGKNTLTLRDVMVGEVWLCTGQSNMGMSVRESRNADAEIAAADYPAIRMLIVPQAGAFEPQRAFQRKAEWAVCSPKTVGGFSAAGYFFGRELHRRLNVPVGLVHSSYGGTPAEAWIGREALDAVPSLKETAEAQLALMRRAEDDRAKFPAALLEWEKKYGVVEPENDGVKKGWAAVDCDTADWKPVTLGINYGRGLGVKSGGAFWFRKDVNLPPSAAGKPFRMNLGWLAEQYHTIYFNGEVVDTFGRKAPDFYTGPRAANVPGRLVKAGRNVIAVRFVSHTEKTGFYVPGSAMELPVDEPASVDNVWLSKVESLFPPLPPEALASRPVLNQQVMRLTATCLYNAMISPLLPYAVKGAIWYQGENNASRAYEYRTLLPVLIRDWRGRWGEGDFPFYIQQLANNGEAAAAPGPSAWAELREAQWMTAKAEPNCGIACAIDVGDARTIHPRNKQEVGRRLALLALAKTYGRHVECAGPEYVGMKVEGASVRLTFDHADGLRTADGKPPARFEVAGADQKFVQARATIDGSTVVVESPTTAEPVAVRYAWATNPAGANLCNASGLPALPFRTDTWPCATEKAKWTP